MSGFIEAQVWYKCFQSAHGSKCQHLPVSYCPSLGLVMAPRVPTVSQSVLLLKPLSGAVIQRRASFITVQIFTMSCSPTVPCHPLLKHSWYWFFQTCFRDGSIPSSACIWCASCLLPSPTSCVQCVINTRSGKMFGPTPPSWCCLLGRC